MTKEEKNRKIAEWLEPTPDWVCGDMSKGKAYFYNPFSNSLTPRNFYTDEAANAMVLEKMPRGYVGRTDVERGGIWECNANAFLNGPISLDADRKTAIANAALQLIEHQERKA